MNVFTTYFRPFDVLCYDPQYPNEAEAILQDIRSAGVKACGMEADLADPNSPTIIFEEANISIMIR